MMCATRRCEISSGRSQWTLLAVSAGMPTAGRCSGPLKLRAAGARKRLRSSALTKCGRAVLPDARVRASKAERHSESELVVETPLSRSGPEPGGCGSFATTGSPLHQASLLRARCAGRGGRRDAASARRMRCRGTARCRSGPTDHSERGKRPERAWLRWRPGKARCLLMRAGRDGAVVVLRGRESRPHGEGRQQDRGLRSCSGGRM